MHYDPVTGSARRPGGTPAWMLVAGRGEFGAALPTLDGGVRVPGVDGEIRGVDDFNAAVKAAALRNTVEVDFDSVDPSRLEPVPVS